MYTRKKYTLKEMAQWTKRETRFFLLWATTVTVLFEFLGLTWLRLPWTPIALIGTAVAFLIGFQNNAAYGRLWEARIIWGGIVNTCRTWTMMICDMVTNEHAKTPMSDEALKAEKKVIVYRQIAWMTALRYALRQERPWETFRHGKTNRKWYDAFKIPEINIPLEDSLTAYLSTDELKYVMTKKNKANAVLTLQSRHLRDLKERGHIWEFSFLELEGLLKEFFSLQGKSERIKNFPYPRQYATLGYDFVNFFVLVLPFGVVPEFAQIGADLMQDHPVIGSYFIWLSIPFSAMVSWVFNTMQRIGTVGENPFEGSANDVPITTMARGIEIDMKEMIDDQKENIPAPYPTVINVQI